MTTPSRGDVVAEPVLCLLRGGGDLATGIAWRLTRAGNPIVVCELPTPLTIRRTVAVSTAVIDGSVEVEGMRAELAPDVESALRLAEDGVVAVLVSPELPPLAPDVVVDARIAKHNIDTTIEDAPLVIGVGPGFTAGTDCHAVVETMRGHRLGRLLWDGAAEPDSGTPGPIDGRSLERVIRSPGSGRAHWTAMIGDRVAEGQLLGDVGGVSLHAPFGGVVRGLISEHATLRAGLKIGDIDPRGDPAACCEISDKALAIGGGVVEAVLTWSLRR